MPQIIFLLIIFCLLGCSSDPVQEANPTMDVITEPTSSVPLLESTNSYSYSYSVNPESTPENSSPNTTSYTNENMGTLTLESIPLPAYVSSNVMSLDEKVLEDEYDTLGRQLDALKSEWKAGINAQMFAQDYLHNNQDEATREKYEKKMDVLLKIREENRAAGLPVGPHIEKSSDMHWVVETLKRNYDILSEQMVELRKRKGEVATRQLKLKAQNN